MNNSAKAEVAKTKKEAYKNVMQSWKEMVIYKLAKTRQRRIKGIDCMTFIKDKDDKILSKDEDIKNKWKGYFGTLLNTRNHRKQLAIMQPNQGPIENITEVKVKTQPDKMTANKAREPDDLPVEVIKLLKDTGTKWITSCYRKIMSEKIPQDRRKIKITPIHKQKVHLLECGNYRGIKLLSHSLKLCERVIEARLRKIVKIKDNQYGF